MKSVLISIQPKWCELIASGKKTVEVRKTRPKIDTPFKVYIYMTAGDAVYPVTINGAPYTCSNVGGKCVIGEFVCRNIYDIECCSEDHNYFSQNGTCLTVDEIIGYCNGQDLYGWEIYDLVIYDKPKELGEFYHFCGANPECEECEAHYYNSTECGAEDYCCSVVEGYKPLTRPPQSWCYAVKGGSEK